MSDRDELLSGVTDAELEEFASLEERAAAEGDGSDFDRELWGALHSAIEGRQASPSAALARALVATRRRAAEREELWRDYANADNARDGICSCDGTSCRIAREEIAFKIRVLHAKLGIDS